MVYKVIISEYLEQKLKKIRFSQRKRLEKLKKKLQENPFAGKKLGYNLFEKKWGPFRIYYIIFEDILIVILVDFSRKKEQRTIIDYILSNWNEITKELKEKYQ